jgi:hypothetical protein
MKPKNERHTIAVDFDGVIHRYDSPWVIFSTRCKTWRGRMAMRKWLKKHAGGAWNECMGTIGLEDIRFSYTKIPALVYLDDRAMRFEGKFPTVEEVHRARPWNKKP